MNVSPILREKPLKAGLDSLHNAEGPSVEAHGVLHLELSCNITASEIKTSNVTWILIVLMGQMDLGREVWR